VTAFDIAIIGGGVIGASVAFELAAEKLQVVVLDRQQPGQEASWAAAGMLSPAPDSVRDIPLVPLARESLRLYPEFASAIEEVSGRSIGFEHEGGLELFFGRSAADDCNRRVSECKDLGIAIEGVSIETARSWESEICQAAHAAAWLADEGRVEPRLLMEALIVAARHRGVEFRKNCPVTGLLTDRGRCKGVLVGDESISAGQVILAAGCFSSQIGGDRDSLARYAPTRPIRGQMVALRPDGLRIQRVLRSLRGYLVPRRDGQIVAGSTSEEVGYDKGVTAEGIRRILDQALELVPSLGCSEIVGTWSGLRPGTPDDLPILGPAPLEGLLLATGHYRNGILLAAVTAKLMREWVTMGRTVSETEPFSPLRFTKPKLQAQRAP
jgi:glycine oxidase